MLELLVSQSGVQLAGQPSTAQLSVSFLNVAKLCRGCGGSGMPGCLLCLLAVDLSSDHGELGMLVLTTGHFQARVEKGIKDDLIALMEVGLLHTAHAWQHIPAAARL